MLSDSLLFNKVDFLRQGLLRLLFSTVMFIVCSLAASAVFAQVPDTPKASDVRIVIDISGSMKKNDPENLRRPALDMLVKLLPDGSKSGVWTFGQYVNMLVKHRDIDDAWKQEADSKSSRINSIAQFTNIGEALEKAAYDSTYSTIGDYQTHVILLTDGMVDINRDPAVNEKERQRILNTILPAYQKAGYKIHTVSLSDKADKALMDRLALATDGKSVVAKTAEELMNGFLEVFDQAVPKEEVPFDNNSFATDSSIEEFTALIFRQPNSPETKIISPDNTEYSQSTKDPRVKWYRTSKYDLVTVKQPLEGQWRVLADIEPQSRITVVSDLSLVVKPLPSNIIQNDKLELTLALREDNTIITRAEFLDLLDIDLEIKNNDNQSVLTQRLSDGLVPGNGIYRHSLDNFKDVGEYEVVVTLDGKTFQRRYSHKLSVRVPFAIQTDTKDVNGKTIFTVNVVPQDKDINLDKTEVVGKLKDPSGRSSIVNFTYSKNQQWELDIEPEGKGDYFLTLRITQVGSNGKISDVVPKPISFSYPPRDAAFELFFEPEPEDKPVIGDDKVSDTQVEETKLEETKVEDLASNLDGEEEPLQELSSEELMDEEESDGTNWILYAVLGVVNILIILIIYILYKKLFGSKKSIEDDDDIELEQPIAEESATDNPEPAAPSFEEPPMDEMMVDDLDEDIDLAPETSTEAAIDLDSSGEEGIDLNTELLPDAADDILDTVEDSLDTVDDSLDTVDDSLDTVDDSLDSVDDSLDTVEDSLATVDDLLDEDPEFSLDDFAPDELDDEDIDEKK